MSCATERVLKSLNVSSIVLARTSGVRLLLGGPPTLERVRLGSGRHTFLRREEGARRQSHLAAGSQHFPGEKSLQIS